MFALILCGGKSTRMGTDKGLMKLNQNQNWAQSMYHKCKSVGLDTLISINLSQVDTYAQYFNIEDYVIDNFQDIGPFNALLSFYEKHPSADVLVVSCDMIDLSVEFLKIWLLNINKPTCTMSSYPNVKKDFISHFQEYTPQNSYKNFMRYT